MRKKKKPSRVYNVTRKGTRITDDNYYPMHLIYIYYNTCRYTSAKRQISSHSDIDKLISAVGISSVWGMYINVSAAVLGCSTTTLCRDNSVFVIIIIIIMIIIRLYGCAASVKRTPRGTSSV